jgi:hypothetical protein
MSTSVTEGPRPGRARQEREASWRASTMTWWSSARDSAEALPPSVPRRRAIGSESWSRASVGKTKTLRASTAGRMSTPTRCMSPEAVLRRSGMGEHHRLGRRTGAHLDQATRMLGAVRYPYLATDVDRVMQQVATELGRGNLQQGPGRCLFGSRASRPTIRTSAGWTAAHRLHLVRQVQHRLRPQRQEQADDELPLPGGKLGVEVHQLHEVYDLVASSATSARCRPRRRRAVARSHGRRVAKPPCQPSAWAEAASPPPRSSPGPPPGGWPAWRPEIRRSARLRRPRPAAAASWAAGRPG